MGALDDFLFGTEGAAADSMLRHQKGLRKLLQFFQSGNRETLFDKKGRLRIAGAPKTSLPELFEEIQGLLGENVKDVGAGFDKARAAVSGIGDAATRRVLDRERQAQSRSTSGLAQRGLFNTTVGGQVDRGIRADTGRALEGIDSNLAGLRSGLIGQQTMAVAGAKSALANSFLQRMQAERGLMQDRMNLFLGVQQEGSQGFVQSSAQGFGQAMGMRFGG